MPRRNSAFRRPPPPVLSREFEPTGRRFDPRRARFETRWAFHRKIGQQILERTPCAIVTPCSGFACARTLVVTVHVGILPWYEKAKPRPQ